MKRSGLIVLLLVAGVGAVFVLRRNPWVADRMRAALHPAASTLAADIARQLTGAKLPLGPVALQGLHVTLLDGGVRLTVSEQEDEDGKPRPEHFHVLADVSGPQAEQLNFCLRGFGYSDRNDEEEVAEVFSDEALPALVSYLRPASAPGAVPFSGTEVWGVPGFRGYTAPIYSRSGKDDVNAYLDAAFFTDATALPADGHLHLLKSTTYVEKGTWRRVVELDGRRTSLSDTPWNAVLMPGIVMLVRFAVFSEPDALSNEPARATAIKRLEAHEAWLFPADACPADVMPEHFPERGYSADGCKGGRLLDCVSECEAGSPTSCYSAAIEMEDAGRREPEATALYLRTCRLGYGSGCTNAAAARTKPGEKMDACAVRTFEKTCQRSSDPWACTMFGGELAKGEVTARDPVRARKVLAKSCRKGEDDPACITAHRILHQLDSPARANLQPAEGP